MLKLFVRQPFTEAGKEEERVIQEALDLIVGLRQEVPFELLTGARALNATSFKTYFETQTGAAFSPQAFRQWRLQLVDSADAIINLRVGLSESSAFEIAYNIFGGRCAPMLVAVWNKAPMKTTLLQDLGDLCSVTYVPFDTAETLRGPITQFLQQMQPLARRSVREESF